MSTRDLPPHHTGPPASDTPAPADALANRIRALWDPPPPPTRGRPARISRGEVVAAAIDLADADGLPAASMRAVARQLGVGTMTLYTHVSSQPELVDAMVDRAYADFVIPDPELPWRDGLERYARELWALLRRHPWLLDVNTWRLPLGPHVFDVEEAGYRTLVDCGLNARQVAETIGVVQNVVTSFARAAAAEEAETAREGVDYATHWGMTSELWEHHFDPARYPSMTRLYTSGAFEEAATPFDIPLTGLLDTIELLVERAQADGPAVIPTFEECMAPYEEMDADAAREATAPPSTAP